MVKKRFFKKLTVLGLATAMLMGMTTNVTAIGKPVEKTETIIMEGYGWYECYLSCDYGNGKAEASTTVYADTYSYYVSAYTDLELDLLNSGGYTESGGFASGFNEAEVGEDGYKAIAEAELYEYKSYNLGLYACSSHLAEIDEASDSCYLIAEDDL